jgi:hypothetical protein
MVVVGDDAADFASTFIGMECVELDGDTGIALTFLQAGTSWMLIAGS